MSADRLGREHQDVLDGPGVWLTRLEVEEFADELRARGYRVTADHLLDPATDGVFAGRVVVRACAVAPGLPREEAMELVTAAIWGRAKA